MRFPRPTLLLSLFAAATAAAQSTGGPDSAPVVRMEDYRIVATPILHETTIDSLASKVTEISQAQLTALNSRNLQSALREIPGVVVSHFNPIGSFGGGEGGGVFIRGMGSSRPGGDVQLSIDGVASFNSIWTHPLLDMLSVDIARSIEVYKGAQPVLYGNMAFAVVDLTPKSQEQPGYSGQLTLSGGSYNTWSAVAETGGRKDALDYYVLASARASDGDRTNSDGRLRAGYVRLGWTFNPHWDARVIYNGTSNHADDPGPDASLVPPALLFANGRFADENDLVVATLSHRYKPADGYLKAYWTRGTLDWTGQYNAATRRNENITKTDYTNRGVKLRERLRPWDGGEVLGGVDYDQISGKYHTVTAGAVARFPWTTVRIVSPYASVGHDFAVGVDWHVRPSVGGRYFRHSVFSNEFAPQAGLVVKNDAYEFHVSGARGVNYPGIYVMAIPPGNNRHRELSAETVDHIEAGVTRRFGTWAKAELTVFRDRGADRIVTTYPPFPPVWKNLARFETKGVEAALTIKPVQGLSIFGAVTSMRSTPGDLPYAPEWSASAGANWRFARRFHLSVDGQYVGERSVAARNRDINALNTTRLGSYLLVNARLACDFSVPAWRVAGEVFLVGENLADEEYQQKAGYPMPGTNVTVGVRLKF